MAFHIGNGVWNNVFAVPSAVTDEHIKLASGLSVKALLLLLRHGGNLDIRQLAELLSQPVADVKDAVNYWMESGLIGEDAPPEPVRRNDTVPEQPQTALIAYQQMDEPVKTPPPPPPAKEKEEKSRVKTLSKSRKRLTTQDINELARSDETISYLLQETQSVLGAPLTPVTTETVVSLYSYYGMQPDLLLMLIHYCVSIGKSNMRYVEVVAADWQEKGIDTHEKAEEEILRLTASSQIEQQVKRAFGIYDRNLITKEKKYIHTWTEEYNMSLDMITLAYERAVELKGKLSFPYINGILSNWFGKGVATPAQARAEVSPGKASVGGPKKPSSYDLDEMEKMITYGDIIK